MDPPWQTARGRGRGGCNQNSNYYGERQNPSYGIRPNSAYSSGSSNFPILQQGNKTLVNSKIQHIAESSLSQTQHISSFIHLSDIPEDHPLYKQLQSFISDKQADSFASIVQENSIDKPTYQKLDARELILLIENSHIPRQETSEEAWELIQKYLSVNVYFPEESQFMKVIKWKYSSNI